MGQTDAASIASLTNLSSLFLDDDISKEDMRLIATAVPLRSLSLRRCSSEDSLPLFTQLESLEVAYSPLLHLSTLKDIPSLTVLTVWDTGMRDEELSVLTNLLSLDIRGRHGGRARGLDWLTNETLSNLTSLTSLDVDRRSSVNEDIRFSLPNLKNLRFR